MKKLKVKLPIIVEGKYDKSTLSSIFDATVVVTGGFGIFNSAEKRALIRKLAERGGIILLTDSDGGGRQIRSYLSGIIPKEKIHHLYIPQREGKESRKKTASRSGLLGVEGMDRETLEHVLAPFIEAPEEAEDTVCDVRRLTKLDLYNDGLSGGANSAVMRAALAERLGLPRDMSAAALIEAINLAFGYEEYRRICDELFT